MLDRVESDAFKPERLDASNHLRNLHTKFDSKISPVNGCFQKIDPAVDKNIARMLEIDDSTVLVGLHPSLMASAKQMLYGVERNGYDKSLGLEELSKRRLDRSSEYYYQNLRQQSGFAAEIISTMKENMLAKLNNTGFTTVRADDLPDIFDRNDQYVDKVRLNDAGEIVERIQTKFFGKNGSEWLSKMMSSKCEKYLDGEVDKLECPKDYYDDVKSEIAMRRGSLEEQLRHVTSDGKTDAAQGIQKQIDKLNKIDQMVERSTVSTKEAMFARLHPKAYTTKVFVTELTKTANAEGLRSGIVAAGLTFSVSAVDNVSSYLNGEITAEDMVVEIAKDSAAAGGIAYGTSFISTAVSQTMTNASSALIQKVGGSCAPAMAVSFAVESYDDISQFAQGNIDGKELAYNLGEHAADTAGGAAGMKVGAALGTAVLPGVGTAAGSIIGGAIGCAITSEAYNTALDAGAEGAEELAEKAEQFANTTVDAVAKVAPEQLNTVKAAFNDFARDAKVPFSI